MLTFASLMRGRREWSQIGSHGGNPTALYSALMAEEFHCYRCGASLVSLSLPISRQDECPTCSVYLHVCRMCAYFDADVPRQCREDDAEEVFEKEKLNFCEWFKPGHEVFDADRAREEAVAREALAALFGEGETGKPDEDEHLRDAEKLFK